MKIKTVWPGGEVDLPDGINPMEKVLDEEIMKQLDSEVVAAGLEGPYKPSGEKLPDWFDGYLAKTKKRRSHAQTGND